jgi:thiamine-phosphate pyrophosphorylase
VLLYYITDRHTSPSPPLEVIADALLAGVDLIQLREKDLAPRDLFALACQVKALPNPSGTRILVNERLDIALAAGLDGVHLPGSHMPVPDLRRAAGRPITVAVSCHSAADVATANEDGADLLVFAPVFAPLSKGSHAAPCGLAALEAACAAAPTPVLALGGITSANIPSCIQAGAAGVAGISLFQSAQQVDTLVAEIRRAR